MNDIRNNMQRAPIESIQLDPANARKHGQKNLDSIKGSLARFGQQTPIVIDANRVVRKGNGTLLAARALGWSEIGVVSTELAGIDATAYAIADNRTGELAEWDEAVLSLQLQEIKLALPPIEIGFDEREVAALLSANNGEIVEDEAPAPPAVPVTKPGDLWLLGEHRVLCGDSTKAEDVGRLVGDRKPFLMVTDPPYGVEYDPEWRQEAADKGLIGFPPGRMGVVANDERADWTETYALFPGHVAYVWHAGVNAGIVAANLHLAKFDIRSQIIWKKSSFAISRGHYHWQHEPCWYAVHKGGSAKWCGDRSQSTTGDISSRVDQKDNTNHGTQKPVECMGRPIRNHGDKDDDVYDPFLGSGTTLIAAEQLVRRCYGMEISPAYCDVIVKRWENLTGNKARLA